MDPTEEPKSGIWDSHVNDGTTEGRLLGCCRSLPATRLPSEKSVLARRRKPRGGKRCIYMDSDEVKACRDLGFELEDDKYHDNEEEQGEHDTHQECYHPLERIVTDRLSRQYSVTSSSGGNSLIHNWRISNPGDDPRDVKARLKVWAQAVALESHLSCITD